MKAFKYISNVVFVSCLMLTLVSAANDAGWLPNPGPTPIPDPEPGPQPIPPVPPKPVDSPFPADGFFLFVGSESADLTGVELVANAESVRNISGLVPMWNDYDRNDLPAPWQAALDWAEKKSNGKPYFVARHGNKAAEGPLTGSLDDQLKTLTTALEGLK